MWTFFLKWLLINSTLVEDSVSAEIFRYFCFKKKESEHVLMTASS